MILFIFQDLIVRILSCDAVRISAIVAGRIKQRLDFCDCRFVRVYDLVNNAAVFVNGDMERADCPKLIIIVIVRNQKRKRYPESVNLTPF